MKNAPSVPVLMYHHVTPKYSRLSVRSKGFESQIAGLARKGYTSLTARQYADYLNGVPVPEKSVLITFDDGYLDNWVHAHPILQRYGMHAVLFVITQWIGDGPVRPHAGQGLPLPASPDHAGCTALVEAGRYDEVALRWSELRAMQEAGTFEIHSHTHTHTRWDKVCGSDVAAKRRHVAEELATSKALLEQHLGPVSDHLCWPQGYFDADYVAEARAAGFRHLYTTDAYGLNKPGGDPGHIYRFPMRDSDSGRFNHRIWLYSNTTFGPSYLAFKAWRRKIRQQKRLAAAASLAVDGR
ncbi:polysaccharide deacetylase [Bordetella ansorpii]|uniref:Polysaccharide deacetylase n=1 Tax=Bordetella ansorpii TaxID=288768 RepID=A0A157RJW0_9BORD|nr:polysaccharide deacetylase family protein [Bordetella ansorpii]SAI58287.1 polysaccharide deacetylase [Bordetella ansorpii]